MAKEYIQKDKNKRIIEKLSYNFFRSELAFDKPRKPGY
jgi:hypothetical protein